jgi:uncharacterized protein YyaL (SSP411 family)
MLGKTLPSLVLMSALAGCPAALRNGEDDMTMRGEGEGNRLRFEKSPYLLQHADNPVDWYPWGEETFEAARREDRPVFLSIGYSTCHWCHVMEHESFEDPAVAALMNETFVSVKVDREERPDVDGVYMEVCQLLTGSGGWPLTVIMTPDGEPFFAGTYFPRESVPGRIGMLDLVPRVRELWNTQREKLLGDAGKITAAMSRGHRRSGGPELGGSTLQLAFQQLTARYDAARGGFSSAPKFPTPHNLLFLLRHWKRTGDAAALEMVEKTLTEMRRGGIFDHVGFGFHRYSTDPEWLVPHFEKMLYDQAMLALAYTEAFQATGKAEYRSTAEEIFSYVLRDMTSPEGGFYSAEDADSEGVEGKFYLWTTEEMRRELGEEDAALAVRLFRAEEGGNFLEEATGHRTGGNILHLGGPVGEHAGRLEAIRERLFRSREGRVHPLKDDKILTDWNGLMIAAMARGGSVLGDDGLVEAARKSAGFVLDRMRGKDGRLLHRFRQGDAAIDGHLDDYAFFTWGLLELYEATFETRYLESALELNRIQADLFWDEEGGGFFFTADDAERLLVRRKEIYDGAVPSGNSVSCLNLLRLARITGDGELEKRASAILKTFSGEVGAGPSAFTFLMTALDFARGPAYEVVIAGDPGSPDVREMLQALRTSFVPNKVVLFRGGDEDGSGLSGIAPFTRNQRPLDGRATAYVCIRYSCKRPTTSIEEMLQSLR